MDARHEKELLDILYKYGTFTRASLNRLTEACEVTAMKKGDLFSERDKADSHEYFLLDLHAYRYVYNDDGELIVTGFYKAGTVITPHFARTINGLSIYNLEVLNDGYLARLPVKILDSLRYSYEDVRAFGLKVVEQEFTGMLRGEIAQRAMSARDRLLDFRQKFSNFENQVPHTLIASYLGVTPVSFSRLRNELART